MSDECGASQGHFDGIGVASHFDVDGSASSAYIAAPTCTVTLPPENAYGEIVEGAPGRRMQLLRATAPPPVISATAAATPAAPDHGSRISPFFRRDRGISLDTTCGDFGRHGV
ncbi:MAG: hypothetical protein ACRDLP_13060, partial [Solirubrobacteraceae bacterium]